MSTAAAATNKRSVDLIDDVAWPLNARPCFDRERTPAFCERLERSVYTSEHSRIAALAREVGDMIRAYELQPCRVWAVSAHRETHGGGPFEYETRYCDFVYDDTKPADRWLCGPSLCDTPDTATMGGTVTTCALLSDGRRALGVRRLRPFLFDLPATTPGPHSTRVARQSSAPAHDVCLREARSRTMVGCRNGDVFVFDIAQWTEETTATKLCVSGDGRIAQCQHTYARHLNCGWRRVHSAVLNDDSIYVVGERAMDAEILRFDCGESGRWMSMFSAFPSRSELHYESTPCVATHGALWCARNSEEHWAVFDPRSRLVHQVHERDGLYAIPSQAITKDRVNAIALNDHTLLWETRGAFRHATWRCMDVRNTRVYQAACGVPFSDDERCLRSYHVLRGALI
jgi:hypothetical protein